MASDFLREIPGPAGPLEALLDVPEGEPRAVAIFGHPHPLHGGTMHTKALYQAAKAMPRIGVAALRFNFRGVGRSAIGPRWWPHSRRSARASSLRWRPVRAC